MVPETTNNEFFKNYKKHLGNICEALIIYLWNIVFPLSIYATNKKTTKTKHNLLF